MLLALKMARLAPVTIDVTCENPMSNLPNAAFGEMPNQSQSRKTVLLAIVGCGGLMAVLCCGGFVYLAYFGYNVAFNNQAVIDAKKMTEESAEVRQALGEPITFAVPTQVEQTSQDSIRYQIPASGPKGSATLILRARAKPGTMQFEVEQASVELGNGQVIQLK